MCCAQWTGTVDQAADSENTEHNAAEYPFLVGLNQSEIQHFLEIAESPVLTKAERRIKMDVWAAQHGIAVLVLI
jgi:hypothetical protein